MTNQNGTWPPPQSWPPPSSSQQSGAQQSGPQQSGPASQPWQSAQSWPPPQSSPPQSSPPQSSPPWPPPQQPWPPPQARPQQPWSAQQTNHPQQNQYGQYSQYSQVPHQTQYNRYPQYNPYPRPTPKRGPDRSSVLLVLTNTVAVALVAVIAVVSWGWLKYDLASPAAPVATDSASPTGAPTSSETPKATTPTTPTPTSAAPTSATPTGASPSASKITSPKPAGPTNVPPAGVPKIDWGPLPAPNSKDRDLVTLQQHALYNQPIPAATCPALPNPVPTGAAFRTLATALVDCEHKRWAPTIEAIGLTYTKPTVVFFSGTVTSDCGSVRNSEVSFYCSSGRGTIYLHTNLARQSNEGLRLRLAETVVHEFFHHVQASTGMLQAEMRTVDKGMNANEGSRRIELQASCISSRLVATTKGWGFTRDDYNVFLRWFRAGGQDAQHGSAESHYYWGRRGFSMVLVGGCNTWTVPAARVS